MTHTIIKGIVAYTSMEARELKRKDFSRVVFQFDAPALGLKADIIHVPRVPRELRAPNVLQQSLRVWLGDYLPTKLRPGGRIQYADLEDEVWVKMGH